MSWIHRRHTLKWGYEGHKVNWELNTYFTQTRSASFTNVNTGNAMSEFPPREIRHPQCALRPARKLAAACGSTNFSSRTNSKVHPRLTLTIGARWEPYTAWDQAYQRHTMVDIPTFSS